MPDLSRTVQRAALLNALRTFPVPTISVDDYALLCGISRPTAYANVREGRVAVWRDGRKVQVVTAPLLEALGYPLTPPGPLADGQAGDSSIVGAYASALGSSTDDVLALAAH
ncbi:hypothetical protein [Microbacterium maritypicum]|uniref:Helix-turn-helix domain-containing protein n=1 Tax=Microbacterium maritypicum TaxID=33918 RepID=A0A4Y4B0C6_MICMQ|nr:hypothetical protein [Microbacterium liquefaciens]GEC74005.1 hypothetical protein MLI01_01500 [Microbacterium liquefaciens]GGV48636.1 hypothetical protein GCM10010213_01510 [Microbacterium liquefaciens]